MKSHLAHEYVAAFNLHSYILTLLAISFTFLHDICHGWLLQHMRSFQVTTRTQALYYFTTRSLAAGIKRIKEKSHSSSTHTVILALGLTLLFRSWCLKLFDRGWQLYRFDSSDQLLITNQLQLHRIRPHFFLVQFSHAPLQARHAIKIIIIRDRLSPTTWRKSPTICSTWQQRPAMSYGKQLKGDLLQKRRLKRPTTNATTQA